MINKLKRLVDVKSIVTLALTGVFCYLSINSKVTEQFLTIYTVIISFYFGTQYQKSCPDNDKNNKDNNNKINKTFDKLKLNSMIYKQNEAN